jgi:hypothetical protein
MELSFESFAVLGVIFSFILLAPLGILVRHIFSIIKGVIKPLRRGGLISP